VYITKIDQQKWEREEI